MAQDPDAYAIWGDWDLQQFKVQVVRWRDTAHPPVDAVTVVDRWWRLLKQPAEWATASHVSGDIDPDETLRWMWVPNAGWLDDQRGFHRVQCWFRIDDTVKPPVLTCEGFRTVQAMTPSEVDRADGMG